MRRAGLAHKLLGMRRVSETEFDYIVVGGGTAGCVLANRLSARPDRRVLLIEAGGRDNWVWFHVPVGYLYCIGNARADWCFTTEAEAGLGGRVIRYPRGRVLGGSSAINGMIYMRGQAQDYDHWAQLGCRGWSWDDVLPLFKRAEDYQGGADEMHGVGGELRVERQRLKWPILEAFRQATVQFGLPDRPDFNRGDNEGVGYFEVNQRRGLRWSAHKAFLKPVLKRPNLKVVTGALARRLLIEERRVVGVEFTRDDGSIETARAAGEVVLAAGAINSPKILQMSGIGPGALLRELDIPVILDAPEVGGNLQDHLQIRCVYAVSGVRTMNTLSRSLARRALMGLEFALMRTGPLTMAPSQLGAFAKSDPRKASADLEWHVQPLSLDAFGEPLHAFDALTASVCNLRPTSRGRVDIRSPDPAAPPAIRPNYLSTQEDAETAARAIQITRRIVAQPALAPFAPREFRPGAEAETVGELIAAARAISTTIFHPAGTCRMGADERAVVDPELRVRGLSGLRVADTSIMPTITSGNTNAPTAMIAERAAGLMLAAG